MSKADLEALIRLDLNNPVFQVTLLTLQKPERHAALETLNKLRQMTWNQAYRDNGLKWEKVLRMRLFIPSLRGAQRRGNPEGFVLADILDCFASLNGMDAPNLRHQCAKVEVLQPPNGKGHPK